MNSRLRSVASRRGFIKGTLAAGVASSLPLSAFGAKVGGPTASFRNKGPLAANAFYPLPLGAVRPAGWLQKQLEIQANGLSGHLDETWPDVGPKSGWLGGTGESWERGPYFMDGLIPLAYLLDDARLKAKVQRFMDWTLASQTANGMFGPRTNDDWWPRMVMLKALLQYQEATGDVRVVPFMHRYFLHHLSESAARPLKDWGRFRWQDEVLSILWVYNRTGDAKLLDLAHVLRGQGYDWVSHYADFKYTEKVTRERLGLEKEENGLKDLALSTHGVNNGQAIKTGPVWSVVSGSERDRKAVLTMIAELDKYHGVPNGMFTCDEHLAGRDPSQGSELCTVVEYMYSLEQSLAITGDASLGDKLERLAFNALPGTMTDDMWAHQYNQEANQVESSLHSKPWTTDGPESNLYGLEPHFGCCTANFHQGWPKLAASLFMVSHDDGLVAAAYAPCEVRTTVRGTAVHVVQETDYPFRGSVTMTINPATASSFPLSLRIPAWATGTTIKINGEAQASATAGTFARIERRWKMGDRVEIVFPMEPRVSRWFRDSVAVERGPLVFSYSIGEDWLKLRDRGMTADWQVFPTTQWNYALSLDPSAAEHGITAVEEAMQAVPFSIKGNPIKLKVKARKMPKWVAEDGVANPVPQSPVASTETEETIMLIPYAAAKLRITAFPELKQKA